MAVGAARPAIRGRKSAGRGRQYRHRGGRACAARRLYAPADPTANAINTTLYEISISIFIRDIVPVAGIIRVPNVMVVHPSVPAKTVPEFIAYAKANPGQDQHGVGGGRHRAIMSGELFKMMTGVDMVHVPYRGMAPALTDLLGGQVQVIFGTMPSSIEYVRAGKLRALAVTTATRSEVLPDIPTVGESVPGYEASDWYGIGAPKDTPAGDRREAEQGDKCRARRSRGEGAACRPRRHGLPGSPATSVSSSSKKPRSGRRDPAQYQKGLSHRLTRAMPANIP